MKSPKEKLFDSANAILDEIIESALHNVSSRVESPIELEMVRALYLFSLVSYGEIPKPQYVGTTFFTVFPQHPLGPYRVDFLITSKNCTASFVVECDGHDFHEKTKEQAARDKVRDRFLVAQGYRLLRFTGSEIWRDPWKCAEEVDALINTAFAEEAEASAVARGEIGG